MLDSDIEDIKAAKVRLEDQTNEHNSALQSLQNKVIFTMYENNIDRAITYCYDLIDKYDDNKDIIKDPNLIKPGMVLKIK